MENYKLTFQENIDSFLFVESDKFECFGEYLEQLSDEQLHGLYIIVRNNLSHSFDTFREIINVNATYIYFKELDVEPIINNELADDIHVAFCQTIVYYYLHRNNEIVQDSDDVFQYLHRVVKKDVTLLFKEENIKQAMPFKIYLAIPYSGMEDSAYEQATKKSAELIEKGYNVFSPITHSHPLHQLGLKGDWDFWKKIDYQYIDWCDEVWVLVPKEGYQKVLQSTGVKGEIEYANKLNKPVRMLGVTDESQLINLIKQDAKEV